MASASMFEFDLSGRCGFAQSNTFSLNDVIRRLGSRTFCQAIEWESEKFGVERCFAQGRKGFVRLLLTELFGALTSMPLMGAGLSRLTYWNVPNGWICSSEGN